MARLPRLYLSGCAQHIIQRGNNRESCFFEDAEKRSGVRSFCATLSQATYNLISPLSFQYGQHFYTYLVSYGERIRKATIN